MKKPVYLDNAATTPLHPEVLEAMMPYLTDHFGNASAIHAFGREARAAIERVRKIVAQSLNASTGEVFFTSGGTESSNMVLKGAVDHLGVQRIITSPIEHHCVLHTVGHLEDAGKVRVEIIHVDALGRFDLPHIEELLKANSIKTLVSLMHGNNEIGTVADIDAIAELCKKYGALFHSDTVQTIAHFPIDVQIGVNFITGSAHKFHGPKGCGFVYISGDAMIPPYLHGGSQERNMRAGTENVHGIVGLGKAVELAVSNMDEDRAHIEALRSRMIEGLRRAIPEVQFNGDVDGHYLYTILSVSLPPAEFSDMILYNLDMAGIAASSGSACSSGSNMESHVLSAIGADTTRPSIRFSFSKFNTDEEIDYAVEKVAAMVNAGVHADQVATP